MTFFVIFEKDMQVPVMKQFLSEFSVETDDKNIKNLHSIFLKKKYVD